MFKPKQFELNRLINNRIKIVFSGFTFLFLMACANKNKIETPIDVVQKSIEKTSGKDQWNPMRSSFWKAIQKTIIAGEEANQFNLNNCTEYPDYRCINGFVKSEQVNVQYVTPKNNVFIRLDDGKKGYTDIPEGKIYKTPAFEILQNVEQFVLTDSISDPASFYRLTDTIK